MTPEPGGQISRMETGIALPRENGALVFQAPWEARAFGLAVVLSEQGLYEWHEFSAALASIIAAAENKKDPSSYYARWVASLETLAVGKGLITQEEVDARTAEYVSGNTDDYHHHRSNE